MNLVLLACVAAMSVQTPAPKTQVMILGVYHFANPKRDLVKTDLDDHMSPKRQQEIADVVGRLAKFKPTKIMVEGLPDGDANNRYHDYLNGKYTLTVNEVDQIGMRLAKEFGHKDIYPIDWRNDMDFDSVTSFASAHDPKFMDFFTSKIGEATKMMSDLPNHSVNDNLILMNDPANLKQGLEPYIRMLELTDGKQFPGADLVSGWYTRNIHIYSLMAKEVQPDDRVLVIFGSGHAPILRHLVEVSGNMQLVEPNNFLKR